MVGVIITSDIVESLGPITDWFTCNDPWVLLHEDEFDLAIARVNAHRKRTSKREVMIRPELYVVCALGCQRKLSSYRIVWGITWNPLFLTFA